MDLALDPVTVNTDQAEKYLKTYNNFSSWPVPGKFWHVSKYPDSKVEYDITAFDKFLSKQEKIKPTPYTIRNLIEKVKENESLFCELEYAKRGIDEADVKKHLHLICQYLQCGKYSWNLTGYGNGMTISVTESTPLFILGSFAASKLWGLKVVIISSEKTAAVCHLFSEICAQVGLSIPLIFTADVEKFDSNICYNNSTGFECIGVVTESADIDSALDVFIDSTVKAAWKLQSIFVQESVYDEVKGALAARCGRAPGQAAGDVLEARGKVFVCDALSSAGAGADSNRVVLEAYRTSRELCALLRQKPTPALSVWAADAQAAHELAFAAPATLVWLNDYATFHGPPASALPVYERFYKYVTYKINESVAKELQTRWIAWQKLSKTDRVKSILDSLEKLETAPKSLSSVENLQNFMLTIRDHSFVEVDGGNVCFGIERPAIDIVDYNESDEAFVQSSLNAVVNGSALLNVHRSIRPQTLVALENAGVPVLWDWKDKTEPYSILKQNMLKKLKIIRSNFGTVFAN